MGCNTCGCSPCQCVPCPPTVLNQPRIFDPQVSGGSFTNGTYQSPTIVAPTINGGAINGATLDCATQACTAAPGTSDSGVATNAFVFAAVDNAISPLNPNFCAAVQTCVGAGGTCVIVQACINTTPNIISNPLAFAVSAEATTTQRGVVEIAEVTEIESNICGRAIDPCGLIQALSTLNTGNQFGFAFQTAVNLALVGFDYCAATAACGYAPLASPVFSGDPTAPTPAPGDSDSSVATTAFVQGEITSALATLLSPSLAFCAAVVSCLVAPATGNFASFTVPVSDPGGGGGGPIGAAVANYGCSIVGPGLSVQFNTPQPDLNYIVSYSLRGASGPFAQIFSGPNSATGGLTANLGLEAASISSAVTVNGVSDITITTPSIAGGVPYVGFVTVVFSR